MTSKFKGILDRVKEPEVEDVEVKVEPRAEIPSLPSPAPVKRLPEKKRGRPSTGKRSDSDFVQMTAYIHKDTHRDVKIALLKSGAAMDLSDLVDDLLAKWLKANR